MVRRYNLRKRAYRPGRSHRVGNYPSPSVAKYAPYVPHIADFARSAVPLLRKPKSATKTLTKSLHQGTFSDGQGGSKSKFFYGKRKLPRGYGSYKALAKNFQMINSAQRLTQTPGKQLVALNLSMFNQTDLNTISQHTNAKQTNKVLFDSCSATVMFQNQDLGNVYFDIYDIIARRDLVATNIQSPDYAWANSYLDEGGANADYQLIGTTPFSSDLFTQYFKVKKITHVILGQGQTHVHRIHYQPRRLVDGEYIQYMQYGARNLTCFTMVVARGGPANDATTKTQVSTGQVALDVVITKQYKYTWMQDNDTNWYQSNTLPTAFTVNESIVDIGSGAVTNDAVA